jgi:hypothetical protein
MLSRCVEWCGDGSDSVEKGGRHSAQGNSILQDTEVERDLSSSLPDMWHMT